MIQRQKWKSNHTPLTVQQALLTAWAFLNQPQRMCSPPAVTSSVSLSDSLLQVFFNFKIIWEALLRLSSDSKYKKLKKKNGDWELHFHLHASIYWTLNLYPNTGLADGYSGVHKRQTRTFVELIANREDKQNIQYKFSNWAFLPWNTCTHWNIYYTFLKQFFNFVFHSLNVWFRISSLSFLNIANQNSSF